MRQYPITSRCPAHTHGATADCYCLTSTCITGKHAYHVHEYQLGSPTTGHLITEDRHPEPYGVCVFINSPATGRITAPNREHAWYLLTQAGLQLPTIPTVLCTQTRRSWRPYTLGCTLFTHVGKYEIRAGHIDAVPGSGTATGHTWHVSDFEGLMLPTGTGYYLDAEHALLAAIHAALPHPQETYKAVAPPNNVV